MILGTSEIWAVNDNLHYLDADMLERCDDELSDTVNNASSNNVIYGLFILQHQPHRLQEKKSEDGDRRSIV